MDRVGHEGCTYVLPLAIPGPPLPEKPLHPAPALDEDRCLVSTKMFLPNPPGVFAEHVFNLRDILARVDAARFVAPDAFEVD